MCMHLAVEMQIHSIYIWFCSSVFMKQGFFPTDSVECMSVAAVFCCCPPLAHILFQWLNNLTQLRVTECSRRYRGNVSCWINPPLVLQLPASCLWEKIGQCCGGLWRENRNSVETWGKGDTCYCWTQHKHFLTHSYKHSFMIPLFQTLWGYIHGLMDVYDLWPFCSFPAVFGNFSCF